MKKCLILLLLAGTAYADGPLFRFKDSDTDQEFQNAYQSIRNPSIEFGTAKKLTVTTSTIQSLSVSTITAVSSATVTNLSVTTINGAAYSAVTAGQLPATATNDDAAAGKQGQVISSAITSVVGAAATGVFKDLTSVPLTAGDWDCHLQGHWRVGSLVTDIYIAMGTTAGDSTDGVVTGSNNAQRVQANVASGVEDQSVGPYRISLAAATTYYYKMMAEYSAAAPDLRGIFYCRRPR